MLIAAPLLLLEVESAKMSAGLLIQVVPVILVGAVLVIGLRHHHAAHREQVQGVIWLQVMRVLIAHIQRHRGLSSGFLNGDKSLQAKLEEVRRQVDRDLEQIGQVGEWIWQQEAWHSITQHWMRLASNAAQLSVANNLDQHNRLIKNILVFIDDIAVQHHLHSGAQVKASMWRDLLMLAEHIGQIRALGTVIASGRDECDDPVQSRARQDIQSLSQDLVAALEQPQCRTGLDEDNLQRILDLLAYIDLQLLRQTPLVSSADFYGVATGVLDRLYGRFDEELTQVNQRLVR
jgi:hypothetical protein